MQLEENMRLREALSIAAVALVAVVGGITQGCGEDESPPVEGITQRTDYELNGPAASALWERPIDKAADAWTAPYLFGDIINIVPYANEDGVVDASGALFARGDQEIAKVFGPGEI